MKVSVLLLALPIMMMTDQRVIDFGQDKAGQDWRIVNDGVMGGLSQGNAVLADDALYFAGRVSLENNGGFSSVRSPNGMVDLEGAEEVTIRYKTNSYQAAFTMSVSDRFWIPNYRIPLEATMGEWTVINVALRDVQQYRIGEPTGERLRPEAQARIQRIGFITDEKRAGPFELTVDYIRFD
ncbi:MAG: CIA30 family protein [Rhodothermales bacterium]